MVVSSCCTVVINCTKCSLTYLHEEKYSVVLSSQLFGIVYKQVKINEYYSFVDDVSCWCCSRVRTLVSTLSILSTILSSKFRVFVMNCSVFSK